MTSNLYMILTNTNGLPDHEIQQMPGGPGGPYITDAGYVVSVSGTVMRGQQIQDALVQWLTNGFPKQGNKRDSGPHQGETTPNQARPRNCSTNNPASFIPPSRRTLIGDLRVA